MLPKGLANPKAGRHISLAHKRLLRKVAISVTFENCCD